MSEKLLIIAEKPKALQKFSKALGGQSGEFNGNEYAIVNLIGHVLSLDVPDETALDPYKDKVGKFSNLEGIPWNPSWFNFDAKKPSKTSGDAGVRIIRDITSYLRNGYIPVIASDIDPSGEGDLLVHEVLQYIGYKGKIYREYHTDEEVHSFRKSMSNLKVVDRNDPIYRLAYSRSNMDYLTQQLTRVATMTLQEQGYRLPSPVPVGRLQSFILRKIGDQLKLINDYKPSSEFESRYKLDSLMLIGKDLPRFKTKDEWNADGLPFESSVREVKQVRGETIPPKALTLSQLAGIMAKKGMKSKQFMDTYQKMYDDGYMTYPRTDDDFITPEQFSEMLPIVDSILDLLALPKDAFTHRDPRGTHVKNGGSHGALRPGLKLPKNLDELNSLFGPYASDIYRSAAERYLMMFLENTEWIRYTYETTDTDIPFKGSVKIITKQGVVDPDEDNKDLSTSLPDLSKKAELIPYEMKSRKPHAVTSEWLFKELAKDGVGTQATRLSTVARLAGGSDKFPIKEGKTFELNTMGVIGYLVAKDTLIGSLEGTKYITKLSEEVRDGKPYMDAYLEFTDVIKKDVGAIRQMTIDLNELGVPKEVPKITVTGTWQGREITFNRVYMSHEFTDTEVQSLLSDEEITFDAVTKDNKSVKLRGKLAEQEYKGHMFVGFKGVFVRDGYVDGVWNGKPVTIKGSYMDHIFTPEELETLFAGGSVDAETHKDGKTYNVTGKLEIQEYNGNKFLGYKAVFPLREGYVEGMWNGKKISFKGSFMDHVFTSEEVDQLLAGQKIHVTTHKDGKTYEVDGMLAEKVYNGNKFVGFDAQFDQQNREGYANGVWKGKQVSFKRSFMQHTFSDVEVASLLADKTITFKGKSAKGNEMDVTGKLQNQTYQGRKFVGFKANFDKK